MLPDISHLIKKLDSLGYVVEEEFATILLLMLKLKKPLLLEGPPGVGKTEASQIIASYLNTKLIRLQCYEGLDVNSAIYEWNYQKQLLSIKLTESSALSSAEKESYIFGDEFLLKRPLLQAITESDKAPVLLIDEIDRADEEFEAFLLELLSAYQISIPEMGTIKANHLPIVVLTSNRTRELSDALKRRCLYHWVPYPEFQKELAIINKHLPDINQVLASQLVKFVQHLRSLKLDKSPGIAESIDWAEGLIALGAKAFTHEYIDKSLGVILKSDKDITNIRGQGIDSILNEIEA
ncbi:MAG: MoxR family ATPase [SAR324 cluster bacterium]|nr:MoxR family ATPase [SAR324 cluster bacterium]MDG2063522.1 MoxR family ATPase [SAR324 cluster bacterium]